MFEFTPRGFSRTSLLIALAVGIAAAAALLYLRGQRVCCAPPPVDRRVGGKDHLPPLDAVMPNDFALRVMGGNGSVAPPYHYDFEIAVDSAGRGTLRYWPGYGRDSSRLVTGRFTVEWSERQRWWWIAKDLRDAPGTRPQSAIPVGGSSSAIELTYLSTSKQVDAWQPAPWSDRVDSLESLVRAAVPDSVWTLTKEAQRALQ